MLTYVHGIPPKDARAPQLLSKLMSTRGAMWYWMVSAHAIAGCRTMCHWSRCIPRRGQAAPKVIDQGAARETVAGRCYSLRAREHLNSIKMAPSHLRSAWSNVINN